MRPGPSIDALRVAALGPLALASLTGGTNASFTASTIDPNDLLGTALLSRAMRRRIDTELSGFLFVVSGASMAPGIAQGSLVLVRPVLTAMLLGERRTRRFPSPVEA